MLRLAHFTVKEYLVAVHKRNSAISAYSVNEQLANTFIAQACLAYLLQFHTDIVEMEEFPLACYAAKYWIKHAKSGNIEVVQQAIMQLLQLEEKPYVMWVQLYDLDYPWIQVDLQRSPTKVSPLYYASLAGLDETVQLLLHNTNVNVQGGKHSNALQAASAEGHKDIVLLLLEHKADVNMQGGQYGNALQAASAEGHKDIVLLLLECKADVNMQGAWYGNALQAASAGGHKDIVLDRKSTRLNSSHLRTSRMPSSA